MKTYLKRAAFFFRYAWLFSLFINLTLLLSPLYMLQVYDRVLASRSLPTLAMLTLGVSLGYLVYIGLETLRSRILVQAGLALDEMLSSRVMDVLFERAAQIGGERHAGSIRDVAVLRQYLTGNGLFAFFDAPWGLAFLAIIFVIHWALGVTALLGMAILVLMTFIDDRRTRPMLQEANLQSRESGRYLDGALRNAEVIKAMGMRANVVARWSGRNARVMATQAGASDRAGVIVASSKGVRQLLQTAMLGLGAYLVITQNLSSGTMIAATILLGKATAPLELAIGGWKGFVEARAAYGRLDAILKLPQDAPTAVQLPDPVGALAVDRVVFGAASGQPPILKGVSFALAPGECLAVIGPSAAGKSTLVRVLLGLWRPQSGTVRLDGASLADWPSHLIGPHIGYLPQEIELLSGTVAENIARMSYAEQASEAIVKAAKTAGAHEMILKLPQGYDTEIGETGQKLSGGQKQRIGLARALFGQPRYVVLDEPNSNLDKEGEEALVDAIRVLKGLGTTLIFVTHKPSLVKHADKVLVLESGNVLAFGPREAVLAKLQLPSASAAASRGGDIE
ncbi:type I secretion system permease/ATPase [Roseateles albus]|uniref:Type I secretion system permease/ATPase n=1 Tax=Roseateles albus TaxID=2987525 RepID=A0ABT5KG08_9BURK|nr:type I secretion system permease/ATPase [Roseateles albus]